MVGVIIIRRCLVLAGYIIVLIVNVSCCHDIPVYQNTMMSENVHIHNSSSEHDWPHAQLPLNSKHLTTKQIKQVGKALGVPTEASVDEMFML